MTIDNSCRNGCVDVFKSFLVEEANYEGYLDIPSLLPEHSIPNRLIPFSKAVSSRDYDQWVHFYEDDVKFERLWRNPRKYLPILQRFNGAITPDFSMYRDMPLAMQHWNLYRSRALGHWIQSNGIHVIANIRFGDHRTVGTSCLGIQKHSVIAVGSHGNLRPQADQDIFAEGVLRIIDLIEPGAIVVYGAAPERIFGPVRKRGIEVVPFSSEFAKTHPKAVS